MLKILKMIAGNVAGGPATVRLPASVPTPEGFRGRLILDPSRCVACHTCAYVCVSNAVTGQEAGTSYSWRFDPGRCTFCARCVENCPCGALSMEPEAMPAYTRQGELSTATPVPLPTCPECGAHTRPVVRELITRAFGHVTEETLRLAWLCERCRRRYYQRNLFLAEGIR
jgi:formate hydrogenlyase subunit 6/NADH:ubiquinone oxidoreductase subunit I